MFESQKCQLQIYLEHNSVYIEISALGVNDPNLWYGIDVMACLVSNSSPSSWVYNLPRRIPISQVIEKQLLRWQGILNEYFDEVVPLFDSKVRLYETQQTLDNFVKNFYLERRNNL